MGNNISSSTEYDDTVTELPLSNSNPKKSLLPTESAKIVLTAEMDTPFNTAPNEASVDSSLYNSCEIGAFPKHNVVSSHNEIYFRSEKSLLSSSISIDKIDHAAKLFSKAFTHRRPTAPADIELGEFSVKEARRSLGGIPMQNFTNEVASTVPRNFQQQSQHSSKSIAPPPTDDMISSSLFLNSNADFLRLKSKSSLQDSFSLAFSAHTSANNLFNYSKQVEEDIEMGSGSIITDYYKINQRRSLGEESKQEKVESTFRQQISEPIMKVAPEDILKPKQAFGVKRSTNQYYDPYLPRASRDIESQNFEASITEGERLAKPLRVVTLRNSEVRRNSADSHEIKSASISSLGSTRFNNMHSLVFSDFQDSDSGSLATVTSQNMLSMNTLLDPKSNFEDFIIPQLSIPGTYQKQERVNVFKNFNKRQDASITDLLKFSENTFLKKQRSNSCSTLFIDFTMIQADLKVTLTWYFKINQVLLHF